MPVVRIRPYPVSIMGLIEPGSISRPHEKAQLRLPLLHGGANPTKGAGFSKGRKGSVSIWQARGRWGWYWQGSVQRAARFPAESRLYRGWLALGAGICQPRAGRPCLPPPVSPRPLLFFSYIMFSTLPNFLVICKVYEIFLGMPGVTFNAQLHVLTL